MNDTDSNIPAIDPSSDDESGMATPGAERATFSLLNRGDYVVKLTPDPDAKEPVRTFTARDVAHFNVPILATVISAEGSGRTVRDSVNTFNRRTKEISPETGKPLESNDVRDILAWNEAEVMTSKSANVAQFLKHLQNGGLTALAGIDVEAQVQYKSAQEIDDPDLRGKVTKWRLSGERNFSKNEDGTIQPVREVDVASDGTVAPAVGPAPKEGHIRLKAFTRNTLSRFADFHSYVGSGL